MSETIIGIGDLTLDTFLPQLQRMPDWGQEVMIAEPRKQLGGNIGNMVSGAAMLGTTFVSCGWIGEDPEGAYITEQLHRLDMPVQGLKPYPGGRTSQTYACIREDGERLFLTYPGVLNHMEALMTSFELPPGKVVFLSGWCLPPRVRSSVLIRHIKRWQAEGRWVAADLIWSDPSWEVKDELLEVLLHCQAVFMNEDEIAAFTGTTDIGANTAYIQRLSADESASEYTPLFIVKQGKRGAYAVHGHEIYRAKAINIQADHTVGAGDLFNIAFLHARFNRGISVEQALQFACIFAGLSIRKHRSAQPTESEVINMMHEGGEAFGRNGSEQ